MAEKIIYDYSGMEGVVSTIKSTSEEYRAAAQTLAQNIENATADWTGASAQKFQELMAGVNQRIGTDLPEVITSLAEQLHANAEHMGNVDAEIAKSIPTLE